MRLPFDQIPVLYLRKRVSMQREEAAGSTDWGSERGEDEGGENDDGGEETHCVLAGGERGSE